MRNLLNERSIAFLKQWERIFMEEGAEGLIKERRGKANAASGTRKGRPLKLDPKVEEDLIAENQRLRTEIEYLKNLMILSRRWTITFITTTTREYH